MPIEKWFKRDWEGCSTRRDFATVALYVSYNLTSGFEWVLLRKEFSKHRTRLGPFLEKTNIQILSLHNRKTISFTSRLNTVFRSEAFIDTCIVYFYFYRLLFCNGFFPPHGHWLLKYWHHCFEQWKWEARSFLCQNFPPQSGSVSDNNVGSSNFGKPKV